MQYQQWLGKYGDGWIWENQTARILIKLQKKKKKKTTESSGKSGVNDGLGSEEIPLRSPAEGTKLWNPILQRPPGAGASADYRETYRPPFTLHGGGDALGRISKTSHWLCWTFLELHVCLRLFLPSLLPSKKVRSALWPYTFPTSPSSLALFPHWALISLTWISNCCSEEPGYRGVCAQRSSKSS